MTCQTCIDKWGQEPSGWGDSWLEISAYHEHLAGHKPCMCWLCVSDREGKES